MWNTRRRIILAYETETIAYMNSVGILNDSTVYYSGTSQEILGRDIWNAVDTYVVNMKTAGVFKKLRAIYPLIGGTSAKHKWNLKNPQNTNSAYRMLWNGTGVHSSTGYKGNGSNAYGNTNFEHNTITGVSESFGVYSRTNINEVSYDIGIDGSGTGYSYLVSRIGDSFNVKSQNSTSVEITNLNSLGMFCASRLDSLSISLQKNTVITNSNLSANAAKNSEKFFVAARNSGNNFPANYTTREYSYFFIGEGLTDTEMIDHYNAVQQLQIDLKRSV